MQQLYLDSPGVGSRGRVRRLMVVAAMVLSAFVLRLIQLQVLQGDELRRASQRNFVRTTHLPVDRGAVYDRNGVALAVNRAAFDLYVTPAQVGSPDALIDGLREVLDLDELALDRLRDRIGEPRGIWRYRPLRVKRDIDRRRVARIEALRSRVEGLSVRVGHQRVYPEGKIGAHLVGYLGKPTAKELEANPERGYSAQSMLGRFGAERRFEAVLAGRGGFERFVVDARGAKQADQQALRALDLEVRRAPEPGNNIVLSIDAEVQRLLFEALAGHESGAAVVVDPRNGAVLGMVSKPSFDPNLWSGRLTADAKRAIDENPYQPMMDKAVHSYFPGSVYKIVTALAALEEGVLQADTRVESPGFYEFGNHIFRCYKASGHGKVDLYSALAASADVYFYKLGEQLGIDTLAVYGHRFGFGDRTEIGLNGESAGLVPTRAWHDEHTPGGYQFGLALSTAIGQGDMRTTPLQMAMAYVALANGGTRYAPWLLRRIQAPGGRVLAEYGPRSLGTLEADPDHLESIRKGLEMAVHDRKIGTGGFAAPVVGRIAGKTGTAQVKRIQRGRLRETVKRFRDRHHAWFAGYAPADDPRMVVVVFLEHGGTGGRVAAPIARQIIEGFHERIEPLFSAQASAAHVRRDRSVR